MKAKCLFLYALVVVLRMKHTLHPIIDKMFSFSKISKALYYFENEDHFGKVIISLNGEQQQYKP
ncbi:MAG: hypothetical protein K9I94_00245 [Bacteroidales bacterium]|nr:hypothetical protein [Bacteroidales bacterium]